MLCYTVTSRVAALNVIEAQFSNMSTRSRRPKSLVIFVSTNGQNGWTPLSALVYGNRFLARLAAINLILTSIALSKPRRVGKAIHSEVTGRVLVSQAVDYDREHRGLRKSKSGFTRTIIQLHHMC